MSKQLLQHSVFYQVLFPALPAAARGSGKFNLVRCVAFEPLPLLDLSTASIVVFDLETTGLNPDSDQIIEMGAQKLIAGQVIDEFSTLVSCSQRLSPTIAQLTGISDAMLVGQPPLAEVLEQFLHFIDGSILVAHNASFDMGFVVAAFKQHGVELSWPALCTLKLARQLLPDLNRKNLDSLADHFGLEFEARHRSIGDVKVTVAVLAEMLAHEGKHLRTWADCAPFTV